MNVKDFKHFIYMFLVTVFPMTVAWALMDNPPFAPFWFGLGGIFVVMTTTYLEEKMSGAQYATGMLIVAALSVVLLAYS